MFLLFLISRSVRCATCLCSGIKKKPSHPHLRPGFEWPLSPCERARNSLLETFACVAGIRFCIYPKCCLFKYPRVHSLQSFHLARPEPMPVVVHACGLNCLVIFRLPTSFIFYISRCSCLFDVLIMFWQATLQSPARYCFSNLLPVRAVALSGVKGAASTANSRCPQTTPSDLTSLNMLLQPFAAVAKVLPALVKFSTPP